MITVYFEDENLSGENGTGYPDAEALKARVAAVAQDAYKYFNQTAPLSLTLSFVTEAEIADLNSKHMGKEGVTDVLSFPMLELPRAAGRDIPVLVTADYPFDADEDGGIYLGDIAVCTAVAERQAEEYGHGFDREITYLFLHGLLHLLGFDHMTDGDKAAMRICEKEILHDV